MHTLECSDFKNLIMPTLWWFQNENVGHFSKNGSLTKRITTKRIMTKRINTKRKKYKTSHYTICLFRRFVHIHMFCHIIRFVIIPFVVIRSVL